MQVLSAKKLVISLKILLLLWLIASLYVQHSVGLADNGDFTRAMRVFTSGPLGIEPNWPPPGTAEWGRRFFHFWIPYWKLDFPLDRPATSAILLWLPGVLLNYVLYSDHVLYLPILSLFPKVLLVVIFWLVLRWLDSFNESWPPVLYVTLGIPLVLMLTTTDYVVYLNSFYQEAASFVFLFPLLICLVLLNRRPRSWPRFLVAFVTCLASATAKPSQLYWPLIALPFLFYLQLGQTEQAGHLLRTGVKARIRFLSYPALAGLGVGLILTIALGRFVFLYSPHMTSANAYHSLFYGALTFSEHPTDHLARLGMEGGEECLGQSAYSLIGSQCVSRYQSRLSHLKVLGVFLREPMVITRMAQYVADQMQDISLEYLGKYAADDPRAQTLRIPPGVEERRWLTPAPLTPLNGWTKIKFAGFPRGNVLWLTFLLYLGMFGYALKRSGVYRELSLIGLFTIIVCPIDMGVAIVGDGKYELIKHLFMSNLLFDIASIAFLNLLIVSSLEIVRSRLSPDRR